MHEYRDSLIAQEMRALKPGVSEEDQHVASLIAGELPEKGGMQRVLFLGAHETIIPSVLAGYNGFDVFSFVFHPAYVELQRYHDLAARKRYGRCFNKPMQASYEGVPPFGDFSIPHVIVMPAVDFSLVGDYCGRKLRDDGVLIVTQKWPCEMEAEGLVEKWRKYLKTTKAGYCIECEEGEAEIVVVRMEKEMSEGEKND